MRSLQAAGELADLVGALTAEAAVLSQRPVPIFVKLAPDLEGSDLTETLAVLNDSAVSGLIATNTTLSRAGLADADRRLADEAGGLSGAPLTARALAFVERLAGSTDLPVMGVGGIMSPADGRACSTRAPPCCSSTPASSSRAPPSSRASTTEGPPRDLRGTPHPAHG
nr:hypothetical protein [Tessaracoccus coleopterorum]